MKRKITNEVEVGNIKIGGSNPIVIQSMTNTDTSDIDATVNQIKELFFAGSEIVRVTVNDTEALKAIPEIKEKLLSNNINVPIVGDFHFNGHILLNKLEKEASYLDKFRINPGNVGSGKKRDTNFSSIIEVANKLKKPVRIGVNWGSLDQDLLQEILDENSKSNSPKSLDTILCDTVISSALNSAKYAIDLGMPENKIIISCKISKVNLLIDVYSKISKLCNFPLHLGLTEAGSGRRGVVYSTAALAPLLINGIGDTIRVSLTTEVNGNRSEEVEISKAILQSLDLRNFAPDVTSCPGCGRTSSDYFQKLASNIEEHIDHNMPKWSESYPGVENLKISVMGCVVNGPGESKHADIGISLPGKGENPIAPVFIDGEKACTLKGENIAEEFKSILHSYIEKKYS